MTTKGASLEWDRLYDELGKNLARALFARGSQKNEKVQRIQFMGGEWPSHETDLGGFCEEALAHFLSLAIARQFGVKVDDDEGIPR